MKSDSGETHLALVHLEGHPQKAFTSPSSNRLSPPVVYDHSDPRSIVIAGLHINDMTLCCKLLRSLLEQEYSPSVSLYILQGVQRLLGLNIP